jgi:Kef-type K+ transport system membrane component KefB
VVLCLVLKRKYGEWQQIGFTLALVAITFLTALATLRLRPPKAVELFSRTMQTSSQLPVPVSILLIVFVFVLSELFGLDAVLGAFAAGMIVSLATQGVECKPMREELDAVFLGFLVPFFFVTSGMKFDLGGFLQGPKTILLVLAFRLSFFVVRGTPLFPVPERPYERAVAALRALRCDGAADGGRHPRDRGYGAGVCNPKSPLQLWVPPCSPFYCSRQSVGLCVQGILSPNNLK